MTPALPRRLLLAGTAGLLVPLGASPSRAQSTGTADQEITDWIVIAADGEITLGLSQPEVGQGSYTALPQILADELDADWQRVKVRFVTGRDAYKIAFKNEPPVQKEGASMSTTVLYSRLRTAGAQARDVLIRAAAGHWKVTADQCRAERGFVVGPQGQRLSYGALAADAARLPLAASPPLKERAAFALIGKPLARLDTVAKCTGTAVFGIDVVVPGMLYGAIRSAPSFTGSLTTIRNEAEILKLPGVRAVVRLPAVHVANEEPGSQHPGTAQGTRHNAVCIVADRFWQAKRAADALDLVFDPGAGGDLSTAKIDGLLQTAIDGRQGGDGGRDRPAARDPTGARVVDHRAAFHGTPCRARTARAGERDGVLDGRHGRGLGADPGGCGLPGGDRGARSASRPRPSS